MYASLYDDRVASKKFKRLVLEKFDKDNEFLKKDTFGRKVVMIYIGAPPVILF